MDNKYVWYILASLSGGFVDQYLTRDQAITFRRRAFGMLCGILSAVFLTPWVVRYYGVTDQETSSLIAFGIGMFWLKLAQATSERIDKLPLPWSKTK